MKKYLIILCYFFSQFTFAVPTVKSAITQPIPLQSLVSYPNSPPHVKNLIDNAYKLSSMKLTYLYASANPKNGGMDCSGTINYLLSLSSVTAPRSADGMYNWVEKTGRLHHVSIQSLSSKELNALRPGDLLFWSGTYNTKNAISHVMIYLGKTRSGQPLMFGSSDSRTYQNKKMWGVSVFDFNLQSSRNKSKFEGYSCIPTLTC